MRFALALLALLCAWPAYAVDPGTASGQYVHGTVRIAVSHAVALAQDDAEGLLDHGAQVRVLLSDRAVPVEALYGVAFPPVRAMAGRGEVRGLLLEFDPADRTAMRVTVLDEPGDPSELPTSLSLSDSEGLWRSLTADTTHISGDYRSADGSGTAFAFDAPLVSDPVAADLRGVAARSSEPVRVLTARARAFQRGDVAAAVALTSRAGRFALQAMTPAELKQAAASMSELITQLAAADRVVVRRATAVVILGEGSWASLVLEDGTWKVAD